MIRINSLVEYNSFIILNDIFRTMKNEENFLKIFQIGAIWLIIIGTVIFISFLVVISFQGIFIRDTYNPDISSSIGDFIGGIVGAIWALAGVLFFYVALRYQKKEFELQRKELIETRKILKIQSDTIYKQQFENTFFQLLDVYSKAQISETNNYKINIFGEYHRFYDNPKFEEKIKKLDSNHGTIGVFKEQYLYIPNEIERFVNIFLSICRHIEKSDIENKDFYSTLAVAQLSKIDKIIFFYYTVSFSKEEFRQYIIAYDLTKNIGKGNVVLNFLKTQHY